MFNSSTHIMNHNNHLITVYSTSNIMQTPPLQETSNWVTQEFHADNISHINYCSKGIIVIPIVKQTTLGDLRNKAINIHSQ